MINANQFIELLLNEADGNEKCGSLIKLIIPKKAYLKNNSETIDLGTAIKMKSDSYFIDYSDENNTVDYTLIVSRNDMCEVIGVDISLMNNNNHTITYYGSIKNPNRNIFRLTRVSSNGVYTIKFYLINDKKFLCEEKYYDQKNALALGNIIENPEAFDKAEECGLEANTQNIFTLEPDLKSVIEYFDCMADQFSNNNFWSKKLIN